MIVWEGASTACMWFSMTTNQADGPHVGSAVESWPLHVKDKSYRMWFLWEWVRKQYVKERLREYVLQTHWILNNSKYYYKNTSIYKTSQRPQYDALVYVNLQERVQFPKDLGPQSPLFMEHLPHVPWHKCGQCWPETKLTVRTPAGCNLASLILTLLIPMILNQRLACSFLKRNITLTHLGVLMLMCLTHSPITSLLIICFLKINPSIYPSIILSIHMLIPV